MKTITIKETKKCDTRTLKKGEVFQQSDVEKETKLHIDAVNKCGDFVCDLIKEQFKEHDHTKLGKYLPAFTKALSTGFKGEEFYKLDWWDVHCGEERHHLNNNVPKDVNLVDVLEMICDCVSAGMARTGKVYDIKISNETLELAVKNTVNLLIKSIVVEKE